MVGEEEEEEEEAASVRSLIRGLIRKRGLEERKRARERGSNAFLSGALHRGKRKNSFSLLRTGVKRFRWRERKSRSWLFRRTGKGKEEGVTGVTRRQRGGRREME